MFIILMEAGQNPDSININTESPLTMKTATILPPLRQFLDS